MDASDEDLESWLETLEILYDKEFASQLKESIVQAEKGDLADWIEVKKELGLV